MKTILKTLLLCLLILSCSGERSAKGTSSSNYKVTEDSYKEASLKESNEISSEQIERKLIKTGNIAFETDDLSATRKHIEQAVKKCNGYISKDDEYKSSSTITTNITVRVPSKNFDIFLADISSKVDKFDTKNISVNDVTEEFLDVQARLKVKKALEQRYSELLKKAKSVKEILEVERELTSVRADVESMEGRLKYLQNQVSFSTLSIRFYKVELNKSSSKSFWRRLANAFTNGVDNIKLFFLGLVNIWPFILLFIAIYIIIKKRIKQRKK